MRISYLLLSFSTIILFSCQKEIESPTTTNSGSNNNNATKLVKIVQKSGADSSVVTFTYNTAGKLIGFTTKEKEAGNAFENNKIIVRNSQGIIQKIIRKGTVLIQNGIDSIISNVHYDPTSQRYTSWALSYQLFGDIIRDSVELLYNTAGKVLTALAYEDIGVGTYKQNTRFDYTYTGNNFKARKLSTLYSGTFSEDFTITEEFDSKISPLILGNEAFVLDFAVSFYSANNTTKTTVTNPSDPTDIYTIAYTYNSANKPLTALYTLTPGNASFTYNYYYQ